MSPIVLWSHVRADRYRGPLTHDFVEESQAVAIVMQEAEDAKKANGRRAPEPSAVKVDPVQLEDD